MAKSSYTDWYTFLSSITNNGERHLLYNLKTGAKLSCEIAPEGSDNYSSVELDTFVRIFKDRREAQGFYLMVMQDLDSYKY